MNVEDLLCTDMGMIGLLVVDHMISFLIEMNLNVCMPMKVILMRIWMGCYFLKRLMVLVYNCGMLMRVLLRRLLRIGRSKSNISLVQVWFYGCIDFVVWADMLEDDSEKNEDGDRNDEDKRLHAFYRKLVRDTAKEEKVRLKTEVRIPVSRSGWRISTLGRVTPSRLFDELFWDLLSPDFDFDTLDKDRSYLFELCSSRNRIVTVYETDRLYLLGGRNKHTGEPITKEELDSLAVDLDVRRPVLYDLEALGIDSLEKVLQLVEDKAADTDVFGEVFSYCIL